MSLTVLLAGGSGFLGTHLRAALTAEGHRVRSLVRRDPSGPHEQRWDPYSPEPLPPDALDGVDVVVNLAGSPTFGNPHSRAWARELLESRVRTTEVLARAVAGATAPPAFLAGNGISYYGDHGDAVLTEASDTRGHALLTEVARTWQQATRPATDAGARVCVLRTAPVIDRRSAPLKQLRPLFLAGLGGRLGPGTQYFPMISLRDWVGAVVHLLEHSDAAGPFNLSLPTPATNADFTRALADHLHRPAFAAVPAPVLRMAAGPMAPELLGSVRVLPAALIAAGFVFADSDVNSTLRSALAPAPAQAGPGDPPGHGVA